ncbi:hypothetical protein TA3x_004861 [Tundrisphaera sp. TA3]|uniref:hypothetical protein n=1 Tax=Tundrisphaera sp. TA3 TaxID=3435775 RepID=UPI003EBB10D0
MSASSSSVRQLSRQWTGRLSTYRLHRNDEHREALVADATRYAGLHLENDLSRSAYWSKAPLARRAALILFLVDRGIVSREVREGRVVFVVRDHASDWAAAQPTMASYLEPTLEVLAALRGAQGVCPPASAN